jgi:hypothetical protein
VITHQQLVERAVAWLRGIYRCGLVLSEQSCVTGEIPDVIGWKGKCRSVLIECKVSRSDFLADADKPFRKDPCSAVGCERYYLVPTGMVGIAELPPGWGLLEWRRIGVRNVPRSATSPSEHRNRASSAPARATLALDRLAREIKVVRKSARNLRGPAGLESEMNLLLASLRRVEIRIEPQTITDFLKWKNRMATYNRGELPAGLIPEDAECNQYLGREI